jgi:ribosome biogenesis GTPase
LQFAFVHQRLEVAIDRGDAQPRHVLLCGVQHLLRQQRIGRPGRSSVANGAALSGVAFHASRLPDVQRESLLLHDGDSRTCGPHAARAARRAGRDSDALAVGDWVLAERNAHGQWWVHARVPPLNQIARRLHDGRDKVARTVIVSNVDTALLVMGLDHDFNLRRLERYLALVRMAGVSAVVVLTKKDLCADAATACSRCRHCCRPTPWRWPWTRWATSRAALAPWLQAGADAGAAGLQWRRQEHADQCAAGASRGRHRPNRSGDSRGRHTTTVAHLARTPSGACIIDTPGLRTLAAGRRCGRTGRGLRRHRAPGAAMPLSRLPHEAEPGCAVRDACAARAPAQLPEAAARGAARHAHRAGAQGPGGGVEERARAKARARAESKRG